jgi:hypothetical protein
MSGGSVMAFPRFVEKSLRESENARGDRALTEGKTFVSGNGSLLGSIP